MVGLIEMNLLVNFQMNGGCLGPQHHYAPMVPPGHHAAGPLLAPPGTPQLMAATPQPPHTHTSLYSQAPMGVAPPQAVPTQLTAVPGQLSAAPQSLGVGVPPQLPPQHHHHAHQQPTPPLVTPFPAHTHLHQLHHLHVSLLGCVWSSEICIYVCHLVYYTKGCLVFLVLW